RAYVYIPAVGRRLASSTRAVTRLICPESCELFVRNAHTSVGRPRQRLDQIGKCDNAHTTQPVGLLDLLHRCQRALAALLTIERQRDTNRLRPGGPDQLD